MHRILDLYDHPPDDGRMICVDEFGPLNLMPRNGKTWRPHTRPLRLRATYNCYDGVMHVLAALDLATGKILYRIHKRHREFLDLLKALRARWPGEKLYLVVDNFSPRRHPNRPRLGRRQRGRVGVPADLQVLAELDRGRVRRAALLRTQRHRPPQPH